MGVFIQLMVFALFYYAIEVQVWIHVWSRGALHFHMRWRASVMALQFNEKDFPLGAHSRSVANAGYMTIGSFFSGGVMVAPKTSGGHVQ